MNLHHVFDTFGATTLSQRNKKVISISAYKEGDTKFFILLEDEDGKIESVELAISVRDI